jgi:hypothetical protein
VTSGTPKPICVCAGCELSLVHLVAEVDAARIYDYSLYAARLLAKRSCGTITLPDGTVVEVSDSAIVCSSTCAERVLASGDWKATTSPSGGDGRIHDVPFWVMWDFRTEIATAMPLAPSVLRFTRKIANVVSEDVWCW